MRTGVSGGGTGGVVGSVGVDDTDGVGSGGVMVEVVHSDGEGSVDRSRLWVK